MAGLNLNNAEFIRSAAAPKQFIHSPLPKIAFAGAASVIPKGVVMRDLASGASVKATSQESAGLSHPLRGFDRNQYILPIEKGAIKAPISIGGGHGTRTRLLRQLEPLDILSYSAWQK